MGYLIAFKYDNKKKQIKNCTSDKTFYIELIINFLLKFVILRNKNLVLTI